MSDMSYEFERFSSRDGFNRSLEHFKIVSSMLGDFERSANLADTLNEMLAEKEIEQNQLAPIIYALLVDKYQYTNRSYNLEESLTDFSHIQQETKTWNAVDLVMTYFHPELGLLVINPKNEKNWEAVNVLKKNEIVTIYAGAFQNTANAKDRKLFELAASTIVGYLNGKKNAGSAKLKSGKFQYKEPRQRAPKTEPQPTSTGRRRGRPPKSQQSARGRAAASGASSAAPAAVAQRSAASSAPSETGAKRMTPFYSVPVTNELFHNGNVEAWKKIIQSYQAKYPGLDVYVFYDGERIHDIHALFKWGKVKHGSTILFAVAGENIRDVAKLQRYLRQGASPRFEDFLKFPVNTVLKLF